jgi:hypothetical protein
MKKKRWKCRRMRNSGARPFRTHRMTPEEGLAGEAEKLETMMAQVQPTSNIFFTPSSLGALPLDYLPGSLPG